MRSCVSPRPGAVVREGCERRRGAGGAGGEVLPPFSSGLQGGVGGRCQARAPLEGCPVAPFQPGGAVRCGAAGGTGFAPVAVAPSSFPPRGAAASAERVGLWAAVGVPLGQLGLCFFTRKVAHQQ